MTETELNQPPKDWSFIENRHPGAQKRWAIQIGTVDSLKWNGFDKLSSFLGHNTIEHSFTRMAEIWCDEHGAPLEDPATNKLYPPIHVRAQLNPGATDPKTGHWQALRIDSHTISDLIPSRVTKPLVDWFNKAVLKNDTSQTPKCKITIFSEYGADIWAFDAHNIVKQPVHIGEEETIDSIWLSYQKRAIAINAEEHDYNLKNFNCHTINAILNQENKDAVKEFDGHGFLRIGAKPQSIILPENSEKIIMSLDESRSENIRCWRKIW